MTGDELRAARTSRVLREAADVLWAVRKSFAVPEYTDIGHLVDELHRRGALLGERRRDAAEHCALVHRLGCNCDTLRAIEEIR